MISPKQGSSVNVKIFCVSSRNGQLNMNNTHGATSRFAVTAQHHTNTRGQQQYPLPPGPPTAYNQPIQYDDTVQPPSSFIIPDYRPVFNTCRFCNGLHAAGRRCGPAANVQCFNCAKIGHLAKVCRSPPAHDGYTVYNSR
jgi:hypothetical protein